MLHFCSIQRNCMKHVSVPVQHMEARFFLTDKKNGIKKEPCGSSHWLQSALPTVGHLIKITLESYLFFPSVSTYPNVRWTEQNLKMKLRKWKTAWTLSWRTPRRASLTARGAPGTSSWGGSTPIRRPCLRCCGPVWCWAAALCWWASWSWHST